MNEMYHYYEYEDSRYYTDKKIREIKTPLGIACEKGNLSMVKDLVERGANIDDRCEKYVFQRGDGGDWYYRFYVEVRSPLVIACEKENVPLVKYLVEHGADVNKQYFLGQIEDIQIKTPLGMASEKGNESLVKYSTHNI